MELFSVKMRASEQGRHISGAERIVPASSIPDVITALSNRALGHPNGQPDQLNIKVELIREPIIRVPALQVREVASGSPQDTRAFLERFLAERGYSPTALELLYRVTGLRGAMLIDAHTGHRLDAKEDRGVRVTAMDHENSEISTYKQHFSEALALASKVNAHPNIAAELCISDDPDYTTGYLAHEGIYYRLQHCKDPGAAIGTRVFLYDGPASEVATAIEWLEHAPVVVTR